MNTGIPHRCPKCCSEMIETEDGQVQNWYGRLVFTKDKPPHLCPNCATPLVPSVEYVRTENLTSRPAV